MTRGVGAVVADVRSGSTIRGLFSLPAIGTATSSSSRLVMAGVDFR